jgi:ADP-heptose:LPS heptosyltransferase
MDEMEQALSAGWYSKVAETSSKPLFEFYRNRAFFQAIAPAAGEVSSLFEPRFKEIKKQNLILFAPGASTSERQWPAENFARLLSELSLLFPAHRFGLIGAASERETAERIISISGAEARNFAGGLSLPESMNLLAQSTLLISNESGPVHMAATTGTACVCISNGNHFSRWNPYPESLANSILTCYPASFGNAEENKEKLSRLYHNHSSLPASEVAFSDVLQASIALLKQIPEQPE